VDVDVGQCGSVLVIADLLFLNRRLNKEIPMKLIEAMIAWNPEEYPAGSNPSAGQIEVGQWPDKAGWSRRYRRTVGACFTETHEMSNAERERQMFLDFHTCVVRDGIDPQKAHKAFLVIDEYRMLISPDIEGAE
jgi:hypothetical protein